MIQLVDHVPAALRGPVRVMLAVKGAFVSVASLIMAATFFCVVILRYGFEADLFAYEEWLLIICFWLYFMASALGTYENSHVNADLLNYLTDNERLKWLRSVMVGSIELVVTLFAVYWAVLVLRDEIAAYPYWQATIALKIPFIVPRFALLFGFGLMAFYSALRLYVLLRIQRVPELGPPDGDRPGDEPVATGGGER